MVFQSSNLLSSPGLAGPQCFSHFFGKLCLPVGDAQKGSQVKRLGGGDDDTGRPHAHLSWIFERGREGEGDC